MLSVSMLSGYMYCPRKLYLQYVLKITEPPKEALVRGSIRHETYDLINKNEENIVKSIKELLSLHEIKELYKNNFQKFLRLAIIKNKSRLIPFNLTTSLVFKQVWPFFEEESELRAFNIYNFISENKVFGDELWEKLTPKIESELRIESPTLNLKGIVDQIEVYENEYVPIELKTGKSPNEGVWPGHKIQLVAYALLLEEHFKKPVKEGFVTYLDIKDRRQIVINSFSRQEVKGLIEKVSLLLKSASLPDFCGNDNKCNACGLKEDCYDEKRMQKIVKDKVVVS